MYQLEFDGVINLDILGSSKSGAIATLNLI
jgi:hypothetical protein